MVFYMITVGVHYSILHDNCGYTLWFFSWLLWVCPVVFYKITVGMHCGGVLMWPTIPWEDRFTERLEQAGLRLSLGWGLYWLAELVGRTQQEVCAAPLPGFEPWTVQRRKLGEHYCMNVNIHPVCSWLWMWCDRYLNLLPLQLLYNARQ